MSKRAELTHKKGVTLLIVSITILVLSLLTATTLALVYRYSSAASNQIDEMRSNVSLHDSDYVSSSGSSIETSIDTGSSTEASQ